MIVYRNFLMGEKVDNIKSECLLEYAWYLHEKNNIEKAKKYYDKVINLNPTNYAAYIGLTVTLLEKNQFMQAKAYCEKAYSIKADRTTIIFLFITYESLGEATSAKEALQNMFKYFNNSEEAAYDQLSYAYFQLGMYEKAEHYCKEALKIRPDVANFHYNLANVYFAQKRLLDAKDEFKNVVALTIDKRYKKYAAKKIESIDNRMKSQ
jgi:tetratricopeptide (TPR) repeat protein